MSDSLKLTDVQAGNNGYQYRCVINDTGSCSRTSKAAELNILIAPGAAGPISGLSSVCEEAGSLVYSISAIANATSYKWTLPSGFSFNGSSTNNSISVNVLSGTGSGKIKVAGITGTCYGKDTSLTILFNSAPVILSDPYPVSACSGINTGFGSKTAGTGHQFQWQLSTNGGASWSNITSGGSNPVYSNWYTDSLILENIQTADNGYLYRCVIKDSTICQATSGSASLNVPPTPAAAGTISGYTSVCSGSIQAA